MSKHLREAIEDVLGKNKIFKILIILAIVFCPLLIFRKYIVFDPVLFTNEWIKTGVTSLLIVLAAKLIISTERRAKANQNMRAMIENVIIPSTKNLKSKLEDYKETIYSKEKIKNSLREIGIDIIRLCEKLKQSLQLLEIILRADDHSKRYFDIPLFDESKVDLHINIIRDLVSVGDPDDYSKLSAQSSQVENFLSGLMEQMEQLITS